jgi:hydrogenase maturation protease
MVARGAWQEGKERAVSLSAPSGAGLPACASAHVPPSRFNVESIAASAFRQEFILLGADEPEGGVSQTLEGSLELGAAKIDDNLFRVTLRIRNDAALEDAQDMSRDAVLLRSMISVHSILHSAGGKFVSLLDPPEQYKTAAAECQNVGAWPVLAGEEGERDLILSAPIILYDYPQIAPESPGDLCDGLEIDEILALRILTMTDDEKLEVRNGDDRARRILERTEMLPPEHFQKLHGALRGMRPAPEATQ